MNRCTRLLPCICAITFKQVLLGMRADMISSQQARSSAEHTVGNTGSTREKSNTPTGSALHFVVEAEEPSTGEQRRTSTLGSVCHTVNSREPCARDLRHYWATPRLVCITQALPVSPPGAALP